MSDLPSGAGGSAAGVDLAGGTAVGRDRAAKAPPRARRRWWARGLPCLAQFMVIPDVTVVNVGAAFVTAGRLPQGSAAEVLEATLLPPRTAPLAEDVPGER
ncbi:hypothetical protein [Thermomonospora amylolytica]|uniref:hypothetical protein n=1 Tax=Thermomonospora amylolytica TaxID=1411117 RepID=UPI000E6C7C67|nr:hypothetical protein [Thermomonospora amylolytica]